MCALIVAPASSDSQNDPSWTLRTATAPNKEPENPRVVTLCFQDLRIDPQDLTTVGEALAACAPEAMLDAVMRHEAGWRIPTDTMGSRARHMLIGRIASALASMASLEGEPVLPPSSSEAFIGPLFHFSGAAGNDELAYGVSAAVLARERIEPLHRLVGEGLSRARTWDELRTSCWDAKGEAEAQGLSLEGLRASSTVLSCMPWERALVLPLWLPSDLTPDERQAVLARVFWAMTYRGFSQNESRCRVQEERSVDGRRRFVRSQDAPWPIDSVRAMLEHNCWIDTLEAWDAFFTVICSSETCL